MQDPNTHSVKKNADLAIQNMRITMFRVNTFCKQKNKQIIHQKNKKQQQKNKKTMTSMNIA